ncbi:MAG: nickel-responsive transcriptional regulator NikR [Candidatus Hadarchaeales archaeon]
MPEKITRMSLTLPEELLEELDVSLKDQGYASRSEAIRDALREFLAAYRWRRKLRGKQLGAIMIMYRHDVRGLADSLIDIQHDCHEVIKSVQHLHVDDERCLEALIVQGPGATIKKLHERLGSLRGVETAKLMVV